MWHINVSTPQLLRNNFSTYSNTVVRKKFFLTKPFDCKTWITVSLGGISHFSKLQLISEGRLTISKDFKTQLVDQKIHQPHNLILRCNNTIGVLPESNKNLFLKTNPTSYKHWLPLPCGFAHCLRCSNTLNKTNLQRVESHVLYTSSTISLNLTRFLAIALGWALNNITICDSDTPLSCKRLTFGAI